MVNRNYFKKLDRQSPISLHQQLSDYFIDNLENGTYLPGEKLPSENELMTRFNISRHVIRQSLNNLRQQGILPNFFRFHDERTLSINGS